MSLVRQPALNAEEMSAQLASTADEDLVSLVRASLPTWIAQGDHDALLDLTSVLSRRGLVSAERVGLNAAWSALACGDLAYADRLLPTSLTQLGEREWSYAAEGALIRALIAYARGDLGDARTHAGIAHSGLSVMRDSLLLPTLLLQAQLAMHACDIDAASAAWQLSADLTHAGTGEESWRAAICAIAHAAHGRYDDALEQAEISVTSARRELIATHLFPHCMLVLQAHVHRERADDCAFRETLTAAVTMLDQHTNLPLRVETLALIAEGRIDVGGEDEAESIAALLALGTHPLASPVLQDLIDMREARLRIRINDLTRARVLIDRQSPSHQRSFLEACAEAESRPSRALTQISSGAYRWHSQHVEAEMIRARARRREPCDAAVHIWRALDDAAASGSIRPILDNPMAARLFSHPQLSDLLEQTAPYGSARARQHLERVLTVHHRHALTGPETHALTARELEVLRAVAAGGDFSSIARMMVLSRWTVKGHFYAACRKLGVSGREAAVSRVRQIDQGGSVSP